jgi:hypothetical protein
MLRQVMMVAVAVGSGGQQPRTHYQVLGISPDEQDPRVIEEAALGCAGHVRSHQLTRELECTQRLNEIAQALITLLDPVQRREYDRGLRKLPGRTVSERHLSPQRTTAPGEGTLGLLAVCGRTCDVKLVYRIGSTGC